MLALRLAVAGLSLTALPHLVAAAPFPAPSDASTCGAEALRAAASLPIIPNVIGMTRPDAKSKLESEGFKNLSWVGSGEHVIAVQSASGAGPGDDVPATEQIKITM